jgi:hypothetical protein
VNDLAAFIPHIDTMAEIYLAMVMNAGLNHLARFNQSVGLSRLKVGAIQAFIIDGRYVVIQIKEIAGHGERNARTSLTLRA